MTKISAITVAIFMLTSCTSPTKNTHFPFDSYNYTTNQITLGISFPTLNGTEQYQFTFDRMAELSMDRLRFEIHWDYIEPIQGTRTWTSLQNRLEILITQGYTLFCTIDLKSFPDWFFSLDENAQRTAFQDFVKELLNLYADQISFLQFGNEWNWEVDAHFNGELDQFITLADIMAEETFLVSGARPEVVLASLSTAGLRGLAITQDRIHNVYFAGAPLYTQAEIEAFGKEVYLDQVNRVFGEISFEVIDLHFYAEYWLWETYRDAVFQAISDAGHSESYPVIVSEFGGPHPTMESLDQETQAERIISYVRTLDNLGIREAYFFSLVEPPTHDKEYWNSYLVDKNLNKTLGYEVMRRFGAAASSR